ncbi:MAG: DNA-processing protein DprA [Patescibacteria group bacterium]
MTGFSEKDYWILWQHFYADVGPKHFYQLLKSFGSAKKAWEAPVSSFRNLGWGTKTIEKLKNRDKVLVTDTIGWYNKNKINLITPEEDIYPSGLTSLSSPPPVLYARGELRKRDNLALAVVGSRKMTNYGKSVVQALVPELVSAGLTIVSGLAVGVDTEAHWSAIQSGGRTIAVLPCGIDQVYPPQNRRLGQVISKHGVVLTEFPLGTSPDKGNFPLRNRIIAGLSLGVLVIEAAVGSGTFHTVSAALEQGKDVFAVPGSIFSPYSEGCAALIKRGAKPVTRVSDILEEIRRPAQLL